MKTHRVSQCLSVLFAFGLATFPSPVFAECASVEGTPVKVEVWISKRHEKRLRAVAEEFAALGDTRAKMFVYAGDNPSRTVAVGRCVPAYVAQHVLKTAEKYLGPAQRLVNQGFISSNWIAVGTSLFNENQQSGKLSSEDREALMDPALDSREFQWLYQKLSAQKETVHSFGLDLPNPKLLELKKSR